MPIKPGGQNTPQEYDESTGKYGSSSTANEKSVDLSKLDGNAVMLALAKLRASKSTTKLPKKSAFSMSDQECDSEISELRSSISKDGLVAFSTDPSMIFTDKRFCVANLRAIDQVTHSVKLKNLSISMGSLGRSVLGQNMPETYDEGTGWHHTVVLCNSFYGKNLSPQGFLRGQRNDEKTGFSVKQNTDDNVASSVLCHEMGHSFEGELISLISPSKNTVYTQVSNAIKREITSLAEQGQANPDAFYERHYPKGAYANTNSKEFFAETFSSLFGGVPNPYALALKEIIKKYGLWKGDD